jgi:alpha-L-fucosidase
MNKSLIALLSLAALCGLPTLTQAAAESPAAADARMAWWREAKFGMFIHWGLYAIPAGGEWHMRKNKVPMAEYQKFAGQFNPTQFNADEWASLAQDAGMKYMVLTTKHHDGFAMFQSKASDYNITDATPFKRDPLKELSLACPKHDVKLCTYYSILADWGHPGGGAGEAKWDKAQDGSFDDYIDKVAVPQVKELLTNYGPIGVMWFDNDGTPRAKAEQVARIGEALKLQPQTIVTPRLLGYPGDFETCEGHIPMLPPQKDWELCTRTNGSWGYTAVPARPLKSLLGELIEAWGKGGNVLLNVGPDRTGIIPADSAVRLREIGAWLKVNGEAVYGSTRGPFDYLPWGWATRKGDMLYLFVLDWPKDGTLKVPMTTPVERAWLLADDKQTIPTETTASATVFKLPPAAPDAIASVIAVKLKGDVPRTRSLLFNKPVTASENHGNAGTVVNGGAGGDWRIKSATGTLEVDMGQPQTFSVLRLTIPYTEATKLLLEVKDGQAWKPVWSEENPKGTSFVKTFPPVTGQVVRLTVTSPKPELRVGVFELFPPL